MRAVFAKSGPISNLRPIAVAIWAGLLCMQTVFCLQVKALDEAVETVETSDGMVDVYYKPATNIPYSEKRGNWGFTFSGNMENFSPTKFISSHDGFSYNELFGSRPIQMAQLDLGIKYNIAFGALSANVMAGIGKISGSATGLDRSLFITKRATSAGITLDNIMKEPYVAPYAKLQILDLVFEDKGAADGDSVGTTAWTTGITAGLLIQLNHLDPTDTAMVASEEYGLANTYLDVFVSKYNTSNAPDDPNFESDFNWGIGLALEF
jgi:hypothetical protein